MIHKCNYKPVDFYGTITYQCGCGKYRGKNMEDKITDAIIENSFNRNCPKPYVIDDSHARELSKVILGVIDKEGYVRESEVFCTVKQIEDSGYVKMSDIAKELPKEKEMVNEKKDIGGLYWTEIMTYNQCLKDIKHKLGVE